MKNKNKQAVLQKFSIFMNEFKLMAVLDSDTEKWDFETQELINYLAFNWNDWCLKHGFFTHGKLFLIETNVIKHMIINNHKGIEVSESIIRKELSQ